MTSKQAEALKVGDIVIVKDSSIKVEVVSIHKDYEDKLYIETKSEDYGYMSFRPKELSQ